MATATLHDPHQQPRRIAVFRALQIGDMLVTVPALRALRHACPQAHITLIGLPWARDFVRRYGYCDALLEFPGLPGMPEREPDTDALPAFYAAARAQRFDLALQMHGSGELSNAIVEQLGAARTAGFRPSNADQPAHFLPWEPSESELGRYLRLMTSIGVPSRGTALEFPIAPTEHQAAMALLHRHLPLAPAPYVCVHPGSRLPSRRWPPERFAAVADEIASWGYIVVLTGTPDEAAIAGQVETAMRRPAVNLVGKTTLGSFAALLREARLVLCNDTSTSHIACATQTPSVVISSGADVQRWRPLDERRHPVLWFNTPCRPCTHAVCPTEHECAYGVAVAAVMDTARRLLSVDERRAA